ncbi:MAG: exodeoxyribonuclease III [Pseudomonadota bacterium]|nr:exodeoxyribonuclease III [Pseudomonadota bacterium]
MRITTWNINSVRLRLEMLARVMKETRADIVCLQEIKAQNVDFPADAIAALGFPHQLVRGFKSYNGVAILSRIPIKEGDSQDWCGKADSRHMVGVLPGGVELHNFYVPAGGDIPDPEQNDKFAHKLRFLSEMKLWFSGQKPGKRILLGDLNIAPREADVWSHKQLLKVVSHTPVEVEHLDGLMEAQDWVDAVRHFIPEPEQVYSWWSYRNRTWPGSDRGRRLDHIWVTPALKMSLTGIDLLREARGWKQPSDHIPITVDIDL